MTAKELFPKLIGRWEGGCRTWFEPEKLADESPVAGEFTAILDGRFLRHAYEGSIQGKRRRGEELIAFNAVSKLYQVSWVDDFHMNYAIMFSKGAGTDRGFGVKGEYEIEGHPNWGWRTVYDLRDDDTLVITAFNATPVGMEAKAVETSYRRARR